ncbi:MAG: Diaminopimelate epimerase [Bacteroidota bacterium]|nr:MAG: Diaminopimelate epimerase [Bacteroidota bacterium]
MIFSFVKYQGTGNDFVIIDNRNKRFPIDNHGAVAQICHRNYGIGADGFIAIEQDESSDFYMRYFNADGHEGSLCGNGSRCAIHYANSLGLTKEKVMFSAADGLHKAYFISGEVALELHAVSHWEQRESDIFLDTGSPHHVVFVSDVNAVDVAVTGAKIAHGTPYFSDGTNVNFVQQLDTHIIYVRTFERGVEAETLSCGTGVTAAALALHISKKTTSKTIHIQTRGGNLSVSFSPTKHGYESIVLQGPATPVFNGKWELNQA